MCITNNSESSIEMKNDGYFSNYGSDQAALCWVYLKKKKHVHNQLSAFVGPVFIHLKKERWQIILLAVINCECSVIYFFIRLISAESCWQTCSHRTLDTHSQFSSKWLSCVERSNTARPWSCCRYKHMSNVTPYHPVESKLKCG